MSMAKTIFCIALSTLMLTGCAGSIERWIVNTRVHQGDIALDRGNVKDAELAYRLALRVDPRDERARAGFVRASAGLAQSDYAKGAFDDALATIAEGLTVDPQSVRLAGLKAEIEQAKLKQEIVISNYPTYHAAGLQIARAFEELNTSNKLILRSLKRFGYTFDADDLTDAIKRSYDMQLDIVRNTNRLILYRQLVTSGIPQSAAERTNTSTTSLLPLP
jgi:tetratricopeptide (TPR) repeat protein